VTKIKLPLLLFILIISLSSCSTLKKANINERIINLSLENRELIDGKYNVNSLNSQNGIEGDLYWNIFDKGYNKLDTIEFIEFRTIDDRQILVNHYDGETIVKSKIFKGKYKNGYFQFKRKWLVIPGIFVNLYRNRIFRIGVLTNGNIITDYNQISFGTVVFIWPFFERKQKFNFEFKKIKQKTTAYNSGE
jgi:hypothetical protein